jgi:hypothetical protein
MFYQEKKTIVSIISGILILVAYTIYGISKYQEVGANLLNDLRFWAAAMLFCIGGGIVIIILIQIVFHIILAVANEVAKEISNKAKGKGNDETYEKLEIIEAEDEMDKLIALKAMKNSFTVVCVGFVIALVLLYLKMPPAIMLNIIFISFNLGMFIERFSQLYFYRKGIRNG